MGSHSSHGERDIEGDRALVVRFLLLLIVTIAMILGSLLALSYPKYTACEGPVPGGGAGAAEVC